MPPKKLGLIGLLVAFLVALPIFVWSIINLNLNPKEKANEVIQLSVCGDLCNATDICLNEESWPQELTCYPEDADNGSCRNKACPDQPNCICPLTTPITVSCNQTCNSTTNPAKICSSDLICKTSGILKGEDGICRKQECDSETDCDCSTPKPTATSTPTQTPGIPNYCGGTCGSNFNCQANYYCYQGLCRNPVCPSDSNCDCVANSAKTTAPKKTVTPKPTKTSTATPTSTITNTPSTPKVFSTSSPTLSPVLIEKNLENQFFVKYALPIFGIFALVTISTIFYALRNLKRQNQIPHITPPVNI